MSQQSSGVTDRYGNEVPQHLDGVNLREADECPNCGDTEKGHTEHPAGYYHCLACWTTWAGDYENASIVDYVSVSDDETADTASTGTDHEGKR